MNPKTPFSYHRWQLHDLQVILERGKFKAQRPLVKGPRKVNKKAVARARRLRKENRSRLVTV